MVFAKIPVREIVSSRNTPEPNLNGLYCLSFLPEPTEADAREFAHQEKKESRPGIMNARVAPAPTIPAAITTNSTTAISDAPATINRGETAKFSGFRSPSDEAIEGR